ncbi:hypothetical protein VTJ49DRAFT_1898 [Mycothermus thermophilus]|uniref:Uncharacterized protein n=1 Tax=Humicola insolens TaxID=85995 RepID=A0ABR3VBH1_HUMIN
MTSSIGIPIKLLNEAQVRHLSSSSSNSQNKLAGKLTHRVPPPPAGPHRHPRNHLRHDLPRQADRGRGQHERPAQGHHRDGARRPRQPPRTGLHPRQPRALLYRPRHVEVRQQPCENEKPCSRQEAGEEEEEQALANQAFCLSTGTRQCSAAATCAVGASVWREEGRLLAGRGLAGAGGRGGNWRKKGRAVCLLGY